MRILLILLVSFSVLGCGQSKMDGHENVSQNGGVDMNSQSVNAEPKRLPIVIAHRGASGEFPEHTMAAYKRAIEHGADFIEPDLVMSKDGVLIVRHDRYLGGSTNVSDLAEFADRKSTKELDGKPKTDWWAEDFTLAEIKTLRARQPFEGRSKDMDDMLEVLTFMEVLEIAVAEAEKGNIVGVYPETKSPSYHASIGLDMVAPVLKALDEARIGKRGIPIFLQSFEQDILKTFKAKSDWPLVQLITGEQRNRDNGFEPALEDVIADGVGPNKQLLLTKDGKSSGYIERAHELGLLVHPWTIRDDRVGDGFDNSVDEMKALWAAGLDGFFTDFPDTAIRARKEYFETED